MLSEAKAGEGEGAAAIMLIDSWRMIE